MGSLTQGIPMTAAFGVAPLTTILFSLMERLGGGATYGLGNLKVGAWVCNGLSLTLASFFPCAVPRGNAQSLV